MHLFHEKIVNIKSMISLFYYVLCLSLELFFYSSQSHLGNLRKEMPLPIVDFAYLLGVSERPNLCGFVFINLMKLEC